MDDIKMRIIGHVRSPYPEKFGVPRQAGLVPAARGEIAFAPDIGAEAVEGLGEFSHLWIIFLFDRVGEDGVRTRVRPPRLGGNTSLGVFATRSPFRPNRIGLSAVRLEAVRLDGGRPVLDVSGMDLVDGTPVLDVKPYLPYADRIDGATGAFADSRPEQIEVLVTDGARAGFTALPRESQELIVATLSWDPRPAYHDSGRVYHSALAGVEVDWEVSGGVCRITGIREAR